jgi:hypothetical protein
MTKIQKIAAVLMPIGMAGYIASMLQIYSAAGRYMPGDRAREITFLSRWVRVNHLSEGLFALGVLLILYSVLMPKLRPPRQ